MRKPLYLVIGLTAVLLALAIPRLSPKANVVREIETAYRAAERPVLRPGSGTPEVEKFLGALKEIDTDV